MAYNEARKKANMKYQKEHQEQIAIRVKKGTRDIYKKAADEFGLSFAGFIIAAMDEYIERHKNKK